MFFRCIFAGWINSLNTSTVTQRYGTTCRRGILAQQGCILCLPDKFITLCGHIIRNQYHVAITQVHPHQHC